MYVGTRSNLETALLIKRYLMEEGKDLTKVNNLIHEELLGMRNLNRLQEEHDDGWRWHYLEWDEIIGKLVIDRELTDDEWSEFKEDNWCHWYNPYNDGRDCTGIWFTSWMRRFTVNGKTIIYHRKSCDV